MALPNPSGFDGATAPADRDLSDAKLEEFAAPLPRAKEKTPSRRSSRVPETEQDRPLSPPSPLSPSGKFSFRETVATAAAAGTRQLSPRGPLRVPHPSSAISAISAISAPVPLQGSVPPPAIGPDASISEPPSGPLKFNPESWSAYFSTADDIKIPETENVFRVYRGGQGPATFVFVHGGGHTALSWAVVAPKLQQHYATLAFDLRGHGLTQTSNDSDLSAETLVADIIALLKTVYAGKPPPLVLCGHSLGGALVVRVAAKRQLPVVGVCVVDVVEGSAVASLHHMTGVVESIPKLFQSQEKAIEWSLKSGAVRNPESARVSVPPQLVPCVVKTAEGEVHGFKWRTDLLASKPHWAGWFVGLSDMFVTAPAAKLLLLADTDRLDKALTIAQMQGKFELHMVAGSGHCVQEDAPDKTAQILLRFAQRNRFGEPIVPIRKPIPVPAASTPAPLSHTS